MTKYGGTSARVFCGPATATLHVRGKTFTIHQGSCDTGDKYLSINIGEIVLGTSSKPKPDYFGLDIGKLPYLGGVAVSKDGTFHSGVVALDHAGTGYELADRRRSRSRTGAAAERSARRCSPAVS